MAEEFAPAKVNLCLHVTGRREDGYHLLDRLVVFANVGDTLRFEQADTFSLEITGPFAAAIEPEPDNLISRAAAQLGNLVPGAAVSLSKALPVAAGIGGGSADAAATLRGLLALYGIDPAEVDTLDAMALALGADVPACLRSKALRMMGIGEQISNIQPFPPLPAVLVNPGVAVPTGPIFKALDLAQPSTGGAGLSTLPEQGFSSGAAVVQWLRGQRNDLQAPAIAIAPEVGHALEALSADQNCRLARMSGSGATCFGLFDTSDEADEFAARLTRQQTGWWVVSTIFQ
ncbi:MAG: 4-(cytidine 5'-diphospho)-2-C-methyl-D-erythritol kinase [Rhizobiales bacterium]|nr:4-(cytidine 5'-diphospho)-2-C-methyl-D-erythritol kinase [Hyphomicrobiales bacterium]